MSKLAPIEYKSLQNGLICSGAVSEHKQPLDSVSESINWHFDRLGSATVRPGSTLLGNALSGNILGLYEFRDSGAGTNNQIIAVNGTVVYYLSGSTWTSKRTALTSGSKARFSTFLDFVFMVNGTEATAIWDGATGNNFLTTGNAASAPTGKYIENFRSRMWIAGNSTYPDRLYYSSLPSSVTTPVITWDTSVTTGFWLDVAPSDGDNITALKRAKEVMLVFKNNHIYRIYSIDKTDPDPSYSVGTYSQESVVEAKDGIYFHHPTGIYRYQDGSLAEISRPVIDYIQGVSLANYSKICGWEDGDHVYFSVGDVTIKGVTTTSAVLRFTISSQTWTVYSYPTQFLVSSPYNDGTTLFHLVGGSDGKIYKVNVGNSDNGTPISYSLIHRSYNLDGLLVTEKTINKMLVNHDGGTGSKFQVQNENSSKNDWSHTLGQLKSSDTQFVSPGVKGRKLTFRVSGQSSGEGFTYNGFEILDVDSNFIAN